MLTPVVSQVTQKLTIPFVVQVMFEGTPNKLYSYHCDIEGVAPGDFVVVISPKATGYEKNPHFFSQEMEGYPTVVRVMNTEQSISRITAATKFVIEKINIDKYVSRLAHERQVEVLQFRIEEEKKKALELFELAKLRDLNPTLGGLVDQLAALTGQTIEAKPIQVRKHSRRATGPKKGTKAKKA